jgi:hypothetical protein
MDNRKISHRVQAVAILICFSFCMQNIAAQTIKTFVDKNTILIGEPVQYKVQASFPANNYKVQWLNIPDSVAHFEVVEKSKIDTAVENNITTLEQTITLTSFDSGRWNTPAFPVNFDAVKDGFPVNLFTDSIPVNVIYAVADSTNELRDIKPIMEVTVENYLWYYIAGGVVLLLIIVFLLWRYFKNRKQQVAPIASSKLSPYDEAMQSLEKLQQLNLQDPGEVKQYHTLLAAIFKWYTSSKKNIPIIKNTTGDVLIQLNDNNLSKEKITTVATTLRLGDAVKFAKYLPPAFESEQSLLAIKEIINYMDTNPQEAEHKPRPNGDSPGRQ